MIDDMAVYIANLGKYNEGYLVGAYRIRFCLHTVYGDNAQQNNE